MLLSSFLKSEGIRLEIRSESKEDVIGELLDILCNGEKHIKRAEILKALLEREKLGSTALGEGVAIPHGKVKGLDRILCAFGRSTRGIDFDAGDGKPTHFFFLLVAPEGKAGDQLRVLARIAALMKDEEFKGKLLNIPSLGEAYRLIREKDEEMGPVT